MTRECLWLRSQFRHENIFWRIKGSHGGKKKTCAGTTRSKTAGIALTTYSYIVFYLLLLCQSLFVHDVRRTTRAGAAPWLDSARRSDWATLHRRPRVRLFLSQHLFRHHLLVLIRFVLASLAAEHPEHLLVGLVLGMAAH